MLGFVFKDILINNEYVMCNNNQKITMIFEFLGVKPVVGDKILIHEKLLDKSSKFYTQPYTFEYVEGANPYEVKDLNSEEFVVISSNRKSCVLKRIYG